MSSLGSFDEPLDDSVFSWTANSCGSTSKKRRLKVVTRGRRVVKMRSKSGSTSSQRSRINSQYVCALRLKNKALAEEVQALKQQRAEWLLDKAELTRLKFCNLLRLNRVELLFDRCLKILKQILPVYLTSLAYYHQLQLVLSDERAAGMASQEIFRLVKQMRHVYLQPENGEKQEEMVEESDEWEEEGEIAGEQDYKYSNSVVQSLLELQAYLQKQPNCPPNTDTVLPPVDTGVWAEDVNIMVPLYCDEEFDYRRRTTRSEAFGLETVRESRESVDATARSKSRTLSGRRSGLIGDRLSGLNQKRSRSRKGLGSGRIEGHGQGPRRSSNGSRLVVGDMRQTQGDMDMSCVQEVTETTDNLTELAKTLQASKSGDAQAPAPVIHEGEVDILAEQPLDSCEDLFSSRVDERTELNTELSVGLESSYDEASIFCRADRIPRTPIEPRVRAGSVDAQDGEVTAERNLNPSFLMPPTYDWDRPLELGKRYTRLDKVSRKDTKGEQQNKNGGASTSGSKLSRTERMQVQLTKETPPSEHSSAHDNTTPRELHGTLPLTTGGGEGGTQKDEQKLKVVNKNKQRETYVVGHLDDVRLTEGAGSLGLKSPPSTFKSIPCVKGVDISTNTLEELQEIGVGENEIEAGGSGGHDVQVVATKQKISVVEEAADTPPVDNTLPPCTPPAPTRKGHQSRFVIASDGEECEAHTSNKGLSGDKCGRDKTKDSEEKIGVPFWRDPSKSIRSKKRLLLKAHKSTRSKRSSKQGVDGEVKCRGKKNDTNTLEVEAKPEVVADENATAGCKRGKKKDVFDFSLNESNLDSSSLRSHRKRTEVERGLLADISNVDKHKCSLSDKPASTRSRRTTSLNISYKEPSLNAKLRQGDPNTDSTFVDPSTIKHPKTQKAKSKKN